MEYNILVTAIGSFSTAEVIKSLRNMGFNSVYGCDLYPKEWHYISDQFCDVVKSPRVSDESAYVKFIEDLITSKNINMIIPLTDIEVDFFNKNRHLFSNVSVTIGGEYFISIARDKAKLDVFLKENNFPQIPTFLYEELTDKNFPVIAKPKDGRSSEGIIVVPTRQELSSTTDFSNYIFQEYVIGDICTIDIVRNDSTNEITLIPRKELIRTKNGAGTTVELFYDQKLIELATHISANMKGHGAFNMEFIRTEKADFLIDVNPRFSAGIGFTSLMGYDIVKNTFNVFEGKPIEAVETYSNMIAQKNMVEVINKVISK